MPKLGFELGAPAHESDALTIELPGPVTFMSLSRGREQLVFLLSVHQVNFPSSYFSSFLTASRGRLKLTRINVNYPNAAKKLLMSYHKAGYKIIWEHQDLKIPISKSCDEVCSLKNVINV